jgi:hypothetical protein
VRGFDAASAALEAAGAGAPFDALVVAPRSRHPERHSTSEREASGWEALLADHRGIVDDLHADASWSRAAADYAAASGRAVRLVTVTDAVRPSGAARAQAAAQLARAAGTATQGRLGAFAVGMEAPAAEAGPATAHLVAHLLADPAAAPLAGAELVVGAGWAGLRSHPRPAGTVVYGGPAVPAWLDDALAEMAGTRETPR